MEERIKETNYVQRTPAGPRLVEEAQLFKGRPYALYIPASIDIIARLLVSITAGLFLLIPMIIMSFVSNKKYVLIISCLFVLVFGIALPLAASRATNQELMVATATQTHMHRS